MALILTRESQKSLPILEQTILKSEKRDASSRYLIKLTLVSWPGWKTTADLLNSQTGLSLHKTKTFSCGSENAPYVVHILVPLPVAPRCRPAHRKSLVGVDFYHSFKQSLTLRRNEVGHVEHPALHFLQELPQVVVVKGQRTLEGDGWGWRETERPGSRMREMN